MASTILMLMVMSAVLVSKYSRALSLTIIIKNKNMIEIITAINE